VDGELVIMALRVKDGLVKATHLEVFEESVQQQLLAWWNLR
jgi:hypothetical protein